MMPPTTLMLAMLLALSGGCGPDRSVFGPADDVGRSADAASGDADQPRDAAMLDTAPVDAAMSDASRDAATFDATGDAARDAGRDAGAQDGSLSDAGRDASTDAGGHLGPAPVLLGPTTDLAAAGAYALLGKTGITNVTGSLIAGGHLGVSPIDSTAITGFALVLDASGQFSTSPSVVSPAHVYAANYAVPTPDNLTSAILAMEGAYTDAASRSLPDFLNLASGHIGGRVMVPGLYTWGSSVDVTSGITLVGGANDVWIFQITNDLQLSAATSMTLAGGARAQNVFWQLAGEVTMGAGSHFEGIILCRTGITMQTGASLHGRALAQTLVALDDNAITAP